MVSSLPSSQNSIVEMFFLYVQQNSPAISVPFLVFTGTYTFVIVTIRLKYYLPALKSSVDRSSSWSVLQPWPTAGPVFLAILVFSGSSHGVYHVSSFS